MRRTFVCLGDAVNLSARLMSAAPPGQIYVSEAVHHGAGDAFHVGVDPGPDRQGQGRTGRGLCVERLAGARLAPPDPLRAAAHRAARGARHDPDAARRGARRPRPGHRHRRRGRAWASPGSSPSSSGSRGDAGSSSRSASASRSARTRRTSSGARSGAPFLGIDDDDLRGRAASGRSKRAPRRDRSRARRTRAAPRDRGRPDHPGHRPHAVVRREAAQDVARGPPRDLPARPGDATARHRARGLPLDRRAVARPARDPRPDRRPRSRSCSSSPTDRPRPSAAGWDSSGCRSSARSRSIELDAAETRLLIRSKLGQLLGSSGDESARGLGRARRPHHRAVGRQRRSTSRSCSSTSWARASTRAMPAPSARWSSRRACRASSSAGSTRSARRRAAR